MKRVSILGSTGSIGTQALDMIQQLSDKLKVVGLAANSNEKLLKEQAERFGVNHLALFNESSGVDKNIPRGMNALIDLVTKPEVDMVLISATGVISLLPTIAAIKAGKQIALASKEVLVAAGEIIMPLAKKYGVIILPVDSEHSAIFQCLQGYNKAQVEKIILTASGGPFRGKKKHEIEHMNVTDALKHPTWGMGAKVTLDCATLINKGLELIEAKWLFDVHPDQIEIVVHPQSIIHSFVQFKDSSVIAQIGWPNMRLPIQYALVYPDRIPNQLKHWDPISSPQMTFEPLDNENFPGPSLAKESLKAGGTIPCIFNASNEIATQAFLDGRIKFNQITEFVQRITESSKSESVSLDSILEADKKARRDTEALISLS